MQDLKKVEEVISKIDKEVRRLSLSSTSTFRRALKGDVIAVSQVSQYMRGTFPEWEEMQKYLDTTSYRTQARFMFGGGQTPQWTGYTIGYHIVQAYIDRHPDVSVAEWTALDPHNLLEESGYDGQP